MRRLTETQVQRMDNATLLHELNALRNATSSGTIRPEEAQIARSNLRRMATEEAERIRLGLLVVAPSQPAPPVYAPQTTPRHELQRRLYELRLTKARYGINAAPEINIEIADIEAQLR